MQQNTCKTLNKIAHKYKCNKGRALEHKLNSQIKAAYDGIKLNKIRFHKTLLS
jgi:hypothetical protein